MSSLSSTANKERLSTVKGIYYSDYGTIFTSGEREHREVISEWKQEKIHNFPLQKKTLNSSLVSLKVPALVVSGKEAFEPLKSFLEPH